VVSEGRSPSLLWGRHMYVVQRFSTGVPRHAVVTRDFGETSKINQKKFRNKIIVEIHDQSDFKT
jgi:hypothetical protein